MEAKMENFLWQKTLLDMYHTFDRIVIILDNKFNRLVSNSLHNNNTTFLYDEMLTFMARKNNCLTAKSIVCNALDKLSATNQNILKFYYKDKMSFKDIAKKEQINIRQIFRNFDKELSKFAYYLSQDGYDSSVIEKEFGSDNLFANNYQRLEKKVNDKAKTTIKFTELYVDNKNKNYQSTSNFVNENFVAVNSFIR